MRRNEKIHLLWDYEESLSEKLRIQDGGILLFEMRKQIYDVWNEDDFVAD